MYYSELAFSPRLGVSPPSRRLAHSSSRPAPVRSGIEKLSATPMQYLAELIRMLKNMAAGIKTMQHVKFYIYTFRSTQAA